MLKIFNAKEYDYISRKKTIDRLIKEYPFIKKSVIAKSSQGKEIPALTLGSASEYSLIAAAFHGSERITATISLMFLEALCEALKNGRDIAGVNIKRAFFGKGLIIVPCVNPDGCEISLKGRLGCSGNEEAINRLCLGDFSKWNANARGVDINHNFPAGWEALHKREISSGIFGPAPTRFGGYRPESEPETLALTKLCRTLKIRSALALHSQGEVIYWNYGKNNPYRSRKMAEIMASVSGYALDYPTGLAEGGGFKDWFIEEFCRPAFTVEVGKGKNPLPAESANAIYKQIEELLTLFTLM